MHVERRIAACWERNALRNAGHTSEQRAQRVLRDENDARAARGEPRQIACELKRVAEPFVDMHEDGLAFNGFLAKPFGLGKFRIFEREIRHPPARLALGPAAL